RVRLRWWLTPPTMGACAVSHGRRDTHATAPPNHPDAVQPQRRARRTAEGRALASLRLGSPRPVGPERGASRGMPVGHAADAGELHRRRGDVAALLGAAGECWDRAGGGPP